MLESTDPDRKLPDLQFELLSKWPEDVQALPHSEWFVSSFQNDHETPSLRILKVNNGKHFLFIYHDGIEFLIHQSGTMVQSLVPQTMTLEDMATYLFGPVLGFILRLRGITCLHASAVVVDGQAIAFLGDAEAGKSTLAASFAISGYPVVSDDVVPLMDCGTSFLVQPGYYHVRLWPNSVKALFGSEDALPFLTPNWEKRYLDLRQGGYRFYAEALPLSAIYVLEGRSEEAPAPVIQPLSKQDALIALIKNTYVTRLLDKELRGREFEMLVRIANSLQIRQVFPQTDMQELLRLSEAVISDYHEIKGSSGSAA